jgi:hypothetical protein
MKHIKPYRIFESASPNFPTTREGVIEVCDKYKIKNYTTNDDLSIDVDSDVYLGDKDLEYLPLKFNYVSGDFNCSFNKLKTLEGCPQTLEKSFFCNNNKLESLEGCPQIVNDDFDCSDNYLITLKGCPQIVGYDFHCYDNELVSLKGCPQKIGGEFKCDNNNLKTLEGSPQSVDSYFECANNKLVSLKGSPQTIGGFFSCVNNKLSDLEHFPEVSGNVYITENTVYLLIYTFIDNADIFMIEDFVDYEIVRNRDTVMLDRLQTFIKDNDLQMPDLEEIKKHYKIIE